MAWRTDRRVWAANSGFSLVEVLVASAILVTALVSFVELFGASLRATAAARSGTEAMMLAVQKMEQLRSLIWTYDDAGAPVSDFTADTTMSPERPSGGTGLSPSPSDVLGRSTDGYVDYVDSRGNLLGGGTTPPPRASYLRRWSIVPLPADPANTLVLQVLVTRRLDSGVTEQEGVTRAPEEARLVSVKTRKTR